MPLSGHPSYPNPTVQEAICEIFFGLPEGASRNARWFSEYFKGGRSEFSFEPAPIQNSY